MLSVSFNLISSVYKNALFIVYLIFFLEDARMLSINFKLI